MRRAHSHAINPFATEPLRPVDCAQIPTRSTLPHGTGVLSPPSPAPGRRARPERIVRSEYLRSESLEPAQRCALVGRLYAVYCRTLHGYTSAEFEDMVFGASEVRLALFYGAHDQLAGFSFAGFERIEHAGRAHAVLAGGGFFRPGYHGGVSAAFFLLGQALRAKLREPRTPLAYVTRATTPAAYRRLAATMPRIYPSRKRQTPADVEAVVRALIAHRQYVQVGDSPWVVRSHTPHDPSRLRRLQDDADVRFYFELNPGFAEGESLLVWMGLDTADIAGGFIRALRARLAR
jgi:hypothetical protein